MRIKIVNKTTIYQVATILFINIWRLLFCSCWILDYLTWYVFSLSKINVKCGKRLFKNFLIFYSRCFQGLVNEVSLMKVTVEESIGKYRSSHRSYSVKNCVLENFSKFTGKNRKRKKETLAQVLSCGFWEIIKNTFFTEYPRWLLLKYLEVSRSLYGCFMLSLIFIVE